MSDNNWWTCYGPFNPWRECPTRPDPGEVLLFYLGKRGIGPDEQVAYLIDLLDLQKSMVYNILKGEGLDSISRCRILVQALKIHPPLLGIDAKHYPIERHAYWWHDYGFSFNADAQGYPLVSEVIAYLRVQRTREEGGRVKVWSQEDLGEATGFKKETVYRMEHDRNPLILENMGRRAIVASALGALAGDQEPTIYRLFGLDPQAYGLTVAASEFVPEVHSLPERLTDEILRGYQQELSLFFNEYYTGHAQNIVEDVLEWLRRLTVLLSKANTTTQRVHLLALQCRYHELLSGIAREQCKRDVITFHTDRAVALAEQAMRLSKPHVDDLSGGGMWKSCGSGGVDGSVQDPLHPTPLPPDRGKPYPPLRDHPTSPPMKDGDDPPLLNLAHELVAAALLWRADTLFEFDHYTQAQTDIDRALSLLPALQSKQLKVRIVAEAGLIHAYTATNEMDRALVLSYFNLAAQFHVPGQFRQESDVSDDHFIRGDAGLLYLRKAMALSAPQMRGTTAENVLDLLETAQKLTPPELIRRHVIILVFQAQAHAALGDYELAIQIVLDALEKSRQIRSRLNRDRIEAFYQQLLNTNFRDSPPFSYLGVKLRTWDHGIG